MLWKNGHSVLWQSACTIKLSQFDAVARNNWQYRDRFHAHRRTWTAFFVLKVFENWRLFPGAVPLF
jgi:hypothetical protein